MQGYLSGRTGNLDSSDHNEESNFRPFLQNPDVEAADSNVAPIPESNLQSEVIYEEANCPKVEVLSEDGVPRKIVVHLQDGRLLEITCNY